MILAIAATLVAPAMAAAPAADATRIVAVFPLWWSSARTVGAAASAGRIVSAGGAPFAVEVAGDAPALSRRLHDAGALILLPPAAAALCGGSAPETSR